MYAYHIGFNERQQRTAISIVRVRVEAHLLPSYLEWHDYTAKCGCQYTGIGMP